MKRFFNDLPEPLAYSAFFLLIVFSPPIIVLLSLGLGAHIGRHFHSLALGFIIGCAVSFLIMAAWFYCAVALGKFTEKH